MSRKPLALQTPPEPIRISLGPSSTPPIGNTTKSNPPLNKNMNHQQILSDLNDTEEHLPRLKKVMISAGDTRTWEEIKKEFALRKDIWKNVNPMEEQRENFQDINDFRYFMKILQDKIAEDLNTRTILRKAIS